MQNFIHAAANRAAEKRCKCNDV